MPLIKKSNHAVGLSILWKYFSGLEMGVKNRLGVT